MCYNTTADVSKAAGAHASAEGLHGYVADQNTFVDCLRDAA
jgi:hypothetical protein